MLGQVLLLQQPKSAGWPALLTASTSNWPGQYATVLVTEPTVTQNSLFLP